MAKRENVRCEKTGVVFDVSTKRIYVKDIKKLTNAQIAVLECGDYVVKQTGNQKHTYRVSYKEDTQGLCLTYVDASVSETVSYDLVDGVWTYNSTDVTSLGSGGGTSGTEVVANPILDGTEDNLIGLEVDGTKYKVPQGSGGGNSSPYAISYFDLKEIAKDKVIDVDKLIEVLESKIPNFNTLSTDNFNYELKSTIYADDDIYFLSLILDSDNRTEIHVNGNYLKAETTTNNVKQVLLLNKNDIEQEVLTLFGNDELAHINYLGAIYFGNYQNQYPFTYDELVSLFKVPVTTSQEI